jgi:hypothetical protein
MVYMGQGQINFSISDVAYRNLFLRIKPKNLDQNMPKDRQNIVSGG